MKKILIPIAVIIIGAGAYIYQQQQQKNEYNVLAYVPADTPLFSGQLTPFPIKTFLSSQPDLTAPFDKKELYQTLFRKETPASKFFINLMSTYQTSSQNGELFIKTFGLADNIRGYFYTLGMLPVFKLEVANPKAIWDLLDKNEVEAGFSHTEGKIRDLTYRSYKISTKGDIQTDLIVAQSNGILTITFRINNSKLSSKSSESLLAMALGLEKPSSSLADSDTLANIIKQHKFSGENVGFINHIELAKGLTTTDGNQLAKQITELSGTDDPRETLQNGVCKQEITSISENWPRTVFGYTKMDISKNESTLGFATIIESKNKVILDALQALRGFIPNYAKNFEDSILAYSLGLNISNLNDSLATILSDTQTPKYQCAPLMLFQKEIDNTRKSLAMTGIVANFAGDVKGISSAIFDYDIAIVNGEPDVTKFDALVALHTEKPESLLNVAAPFTGIQLDLTNNGPAASLNALLPMPPELKLDPKIAIKGEHIIIYNGAQALAEADKLGKEKLVDNGFLQMSFDLKKIFAPIIKNPQLAEMILPKNTEMLADYDTRMSVNLDVNDQGIRIDSTINYKSMPSK